MPALKVAACVESFISGNGRLAKWRPSAGGGKTIEGWRYVREVAVAHVANEESDRYRVNKRFAKRLRLQGGAEISDEKLSAKLATLEKDRFLGVTCRGKTLFAQWDLGEREADVLVDLQGSRLWNPPARTQSVERKATLSSEGGTREAAPGTAAYAWRKLGLIDEKGIPTRRGQVFSAFNGGEGLAIAAALEDSHYALDEMIWHLANLRGGYRFEEATGGSEVLASACRSCFGPVSYEGYLELGLPIGYGHGAAEVLQAHLEGKDLRSSNLNHWGKGDVERILSEWLSLLRHIRPANSGWSFIIRGIPAARKTGKTSKARDSISASKNPLARSCTTPALELAIHLAT